MAALGVALALGLAGYAALVTFTTPSGPTTLVVYSYDSLLGGGCGTGNASAYDQVFGAFDRAYHANVELECPAGTLVSALEAQANAPQADVVVGLDEITGPQAVALGLLDAYSPPGLSNLGANVTGALGGAGYVTPYEYGYLAMDYNPELANATDGAIANWSFPGMAAHAPWAAALTCEDPTTDITGEEFLLWEIAFYSEVLHQPWEPFWQSVDGSMQVAPDWTTAFNDFSTATSPAVIPSYSLDPAYAAEYGGSPLRSTVGTWNGTSYGWETVYGSGIVRGSTHLGLDQDLLRWLLNASVESAFPLNEWEYPANATVAWPAVFQDGIPPASIIPLDAHGAGGLVTNLSAELDEWQSLENGPE